MKLDRAITYLGLGSNKGNPVENIERAIELLGNNPRIIHVRSSHFYKTSPVGYKEQDWFINAVVELQTNLPPLELLSLCQEIERTLGRVRTVKWGPRIIDLDVLFYDQEIVKDESLEIPHPQLHLRKFVLIALCELNPNLSHPVLHKTLSEILENLKNNDKVIKL